MDRRRWLQRFAGVIVGAAVSLGWGRLADDVQAQTDGKVSLRDRLQAGLLTRRPEEKAFVDHIVDLVEQQQLPLDLVLSTYRWSVKQRPDFPFPYFQEAIRRRAAAIGVTV
jgi:hypothetical protein